MKQRTWIKGIVAVLILLAGCAPGAPKDSGKFIRGEAVVEDVEILFLESFPLGVHAVASGYLPDPCTDIDEVSVERDGNHFKVLITTLREAEVMCAQVIEVFEQNIPLDVYGLPAGDYTVTVNGIDAEFAFLQDNSLPDS
jgi:inhibitor of cysteine peptidase